MSQSISISSFRLYAQAFHSIPAFGPPMLSFYPVQLVSAFPLKTAAAVSFFVLRAIVYSMSFSFHIQIELR